MEEKKGYTEGYQDTPKLPWASSQSYFSLNTHNSHNKCCRNSSSSQVDGIRNFFKDIWSPKKTKKASNA